MKRPLFVKGSIALAFAFIFTSVSAQVTLPRPSPAAKVSQKIGISTVNVNYSRPSVKNREVWGKMVPYGWNVQQFGAGNSAPWRAGANENTIIEFSHPAKVAGQSIPAGSYGLFFTINEDNSAEVILSKDFRSWGSFFYNKDQDQMRSRIDTRAISHTELLTYDFINLTKNTAELVLNWEKKQFPVLIEFAVDDIVIANATDELKGAIGFNAIGFTGAANYTLQNKVNLENGLIWIDKAIAQNNVYATKKIRADILRQMNRIADADKELSEAIAVANENNLNLLGYQYLNAGQNDKAIEMLTLNAQRFPKSANVWDSLGEAYVKKGDKVNAIKNFKKSLTLNPPAATKANSEKFLAELGAK
jgi:tetratricopeptide (TPR) repeat protein